MGGGPAGAVGARGGAGDGLTSLLRKFDEETRKRSRKTRCSFRLFHGRLRRFVFVSFYASRSQPLSSSTRNSVGFAFDRPRLDTPTTCTALLRSQCPNRLSFLPTPSTDALSNDVALEQRPLHELRQLVSPPRRRGHHVEGLQLALDVLPGLCVLIGGRISASINSLNQQPM